MNRLTGAFSIYLLLGLSFFGFASPQKTAAQGSRSESVSRNTVRNLNSKIDDFKYSLNNEFDNRRVSPDEESQFNDDFDNFANSVRQFSDKLDRRRENADDVRDVLSAAKPVNDFVYAKRFSNAAQKDWSDIRSQLDKLSANYNVAWNWNGANSTFPADRNNPNNYPNDNYPPTRTNSNSYSYNLTGTYRLDETRSENAREIAERAVSSGNVRDADNAQNDLEDKLESPQQIVIEVRGNQVTLESSNAAQVTFTADGRDKTETLSNGKTLRVRTTLRGQELTVSSLGGDTDYTVVFASIENGKSLRVTRRVTTDYLQQTVFIESVYQKTDAVANFGSTPNYNNGGYSSNDPRDNGGNNYPTTRGGRTGDFIVPNGTILVGLLENDIDTKVSQNNDRFTLNVQSPNDYRGATIEGYISGVNRSGKVTGRSQITFNFERIRLANGETYEFAGYLQAVTDETGKAVKIDTEGSAKGDNQTKQTVTRGGIGAGIGAVIGAIAGGAKGAAIGAIIGGGAGAGSVYIQGKDDLQLKSGSSITVQSSAPNR